MSHDFDFGKDPNTFKGKREKAFQQMWPDN